MRLTLRTAKKNTDVLALPVLVMTGRIFLVRGCWTRETCRDTDWKVEAYFMWYLKETSHSQRRIR